MNINKELIGNISVGLLTKNMGDLIIEEACSNFLTTFGLDGNHISSHKRVSPLEFIKYRHFKYWIVGGSNIIGNRNFRQGQLPFGFMTSQIYRPKLLMLGCGWVDNKKKVDFYNKKKINLIYPKDFPHSVRDSHTKNLLESIGFTNIFNTGCPTLWKLPKNINYLLSKKKSKNCVFTLTDYRRDYERDKELINILCLNYEELFFWPQGSNDNSYLQELITKYKLIKQSKKINIIQRSLQEFDLLLSKSNIDYVGTRLHGGIRALQNLKRTIIISIDNRASEIGKDNNLCIVERERLIQDLKLKINNFESDIQINYETISNYKKEFEKFFSNI